MDTKLKVSGKKKSLNHWLKNPKLTVKDKVFQYEGLVKIQGRRKKTISGEEATLQKKISKELKTFKNEVNEFREVLNEVQYGDKRRLHAILAGHKDLQLAYGDRYPDALYHAVIDDCHYKRKQLNKLYYLKTLKTKVLFDLQLEYSFLMNDYEDENDLKDPDPYKRKLTYRYNKTIAHKQAAESLNLTYLSMIDGLEKDRFHFDVIIDALGDDKKEQNQIVMRAKKIGQSAAHDLKEAQKFYNRMIEKVWQNIKKREKSIKMIRERVESLSTDIRLLIRVESNTNNIAKLSEESPRIDKSLEEDVQSLEQMFKRVKDALLTRSYDEFLTRFEDQARQKTRLLKLLEKSLEKRDSLLNKKNNAILISNNLKDSISANGDYDKYKANKKEMLHQLEIEKKKEADFTKLRKSRGALLVNIKTALQNMLAMMACIKLEIGEKQTTPKDEKVKDKKGRRSETKIRKGQFRMTTRSLSTDEYELEKIDTDAINLLTQVTQKATILFGMSNFDLSPEEEEKARYLYQSYVAEYKSKALFKKQDSDFQIFTIEYEIIDTSVLTRDDIKLQSKRLVNNNAKTD